MMTRGMSPSNSLARNSPRKPLPQDLHSNENAFDPGIGSPATSAPSRAPLCPIPVAGQNPVSEACKNPVSTPRGKVGPSTPRTKEKSSQRSENFEASMLSTPEKHVVPSTALSGVSGRNRFGWQQRQLSANGTERDIRPSSPSGRNGQDNSSTDDGTDVITPPKPLMTSMGTEITHNNLGTGGGQLPNPRTVSTPRSSRSTRSFANDSETGGGISCNQNGTPNRSVSRTLKYNHQVPNNSSSSATGTVSNRPGPLGTRLQGFSLQLARPFQSHASDSNLTEVPHFELEEDSSFWNDHNVQVLIRARPLNTSEISSHGLSRCIRQESSHTITWIGPPESRFTFDHVACETISQEKLFRIAGLPMVDNCMTGYNSCMFAYGQTGSGKTHTMLGDIGDLEQRPSDNRGMTPRIFEYLFARIQMEEENRKSEHLKFICKCSFLEIYNEQITDLLEPSSTNLQMREDVKKGVYVENLREVEVTSVHDVVFLLLQGAANRRVAATNMNQESSRSHSVFTCVIESKWETDSMTNIRFGRLNLVDLAGSERQKMSGAEGDRLKEAANINKSLSTLGLVIMILVDVAHGKQRHVPYRDSKLTFLLQDSLGGNSKTTIIANVSPSIYCASETLSTLKFAQRAKFIQNNAVVNEDASGDVLALRQQIQQLKEELNRLRRQSISRIPFSHVIGSPESSAPDASGHSLAIDSQRSFVQKIKTLEAILAGSLRREQATDNTAKRLMAEIEQLNHLVRQREDDVQCGKMMLRFREDKIRRLEAAVDSVLSPEIYMKEENLALREELQLIRARLDRSPELTRFAMENIRLMEQIRRLQDFYEGGEREVLMEEVSSLRDQLMEFLEGKLTAEQDSVVQAPEGENYEAESKSCRTKFDTSLMDNAKSSREFDDLRLQITHLKSTCADQLKELEMWRRNENLGLAMAKADQLEKLLADSIHENELLQQEIQKQKETLEAAKGLAERLQVTEASLAAAQETAASAQATVKQIRLETEDIAIQQRQSFSEIHEAATMWRLQELQLRAQLEEAQKVIETLSLQKGHDTNQATGLEDRIEHETEFQNTEAVMNLRLELEAMKHLFEEECAHRKERDEINLCLTQQLENAEEKELEISKKLLETAESLDLEKSVVEALENQQLLSINQIKHLQEQKKELTEGLKTREKEVQVLTGYVLNLQSELQKEFEMRLFEMGDKEGNHDSNLKVKLEKMKRALEHAEELNSKLQHDHDSLKALELEKDLVRADAEMETTQAITLLQSEILSICEDQAMTKQCELKAEVNLMELTEDFRDLQVKYKDLLEENSQLVKLYENKLKEKDAEISMLTQDWKIAVTKLSECLFEGNQALDDVTQEFESLTEEYSPSKRSENGLSLVLSDERGNTIRVLQERLVHAQKVAKGIENKVRVLSEATIAFTEVQRKEKIDMQKDLQDMALTIEKLNLNLHLSEESLEKTLYESEQLQSEIQAKESLVQGLHVQLENSESQKNKLQQEFDLLKQNRETIINSYEHKLQMAEDDIHKLKLRAETAESAYANLLAHLKSQTYQLAEENVLMLVEIQVLQGLLNFHEEVLQEELLNCQSILEAKEGEFLKQLTELEMEKRACEMGTEELRKVACEAWQRVSEEEKSIKALQSEHYNLQLNLSVAESEYSAVAMDLTKSKREWECERARLENALKESDFVIAAKEQEVSSLHVHLEALAAIADSLCVEEEENVERVSTLSQKILVGLQVESLYSKETIVELEKDHNQNLVELKSREDDIDRILTQLLEYAQKEIRMELEIEMLREKTTEQDEKKTEFESLTTQLNVSRERVQQLETSNINLLEALTKEKALTFQLSLELQEKHEHLDEMRCKHSQSQAQCQRLDEELHKFGNTVEQLEQDNVCLLGKMEEEKDCVLHLQRALAAAHEKANKATSLNKQLEESIAKKDNMLQQQIEQLHECYAKLKHLEREREILHEEVNKQQCLFAAIQLELETTRALYSEDIKQMTECLAGERIRMLVELELIKHLFECKGYLLQEDLSSSQSSFQVFEQNYCDEIRTLKKETAILRDRITELDAFIQNLTQELQQSQESAQMFQLQAKQVEQRCTCLSIELEQKSEQWAEVKLLGMVETEIIEQVFQRHIQILHEVLLVSQSSLEAAKQLLDAETGHSENESKLSRNQNTEQHAVIGELTGRLEKYIVYVQKLELQAKDAEQRCNRKAAKIEELEREKLLAHDVMEALKAENKQSCESFVQIKNMHAACLENLRQKEMDFERFLTQSEQQKTCHEEDSLKSEFTIGVLQSEFKEVIARAEELDKKYRDVLEQLQARDLEVRKLSEEHHQLFEKITLEKEEKLKLKTELEVQMDLVQKESQQKWMILHSNNKAQYLQKEKELVAQLEEVHAKVDKLMIERLDLKVDVDRKSQDMDILRQELQKSCDIVAEVKGAHLKTLEVLQSKEFEIEMLSTRVKDMGMKESQLCLEIACLQEQRQSLDKGNPGDINIYQTGCHKVLNLIDVVQAHEIRIFSLHDKIERCLTLVSNHVETKTCARFISACNKVLSDIQSLVEGCSDFKEERTKSEFDEVKMQVKSMSMLIIQLQNEKKHMQEEKDKREAAIKNWHHHFHKHTHATSEKAVEVVHGHEMKLISLQTKIEMITEWLSHDVGHDTKVAFIEGCELVLSEVEKEVQTSREHAELAWKKVEEVLAEKKMVESELVKKVEEVLAEKKIVEHELVKKEHALKGLQLDLNLLQESASEARDKRVEADEAIAMINKLQAELSEKYSRIQILEDEVCRLQESSLVVNRKVQAVDATASEIRKQALSLEAENVHLKSRIEELLVRNNSVEEELEDKQHTVEALEMELLEVSCLMEQKMGDMNCDLNLVMKERDRLRTELVVLTEQLEMAQQLAEEHEAVAVEARQIAETSKTQAEQKEEEAKLLERSVQELESTINALETQVGLVKNDADRQRLMREDIEVELQALRHQMSVMQARQSESEAQQNLWGDNQRDLEAKEMYLLEAEKRYQVLKKECAEKDKQIKNCKAHISELSFAAERQASEHHQKLRALESMVEHLKVEQKSSACVPTTSKIGDKCVKSRGSGSPFKCIGSGLTHQINSEMDEELISNREKIEELEALASSRQKEIFMLNTRLAEAESMTHDVIRDLLGVKLDITNYASLMNGQHVQTVTEKARVRSEESQEKDGEFERLKKQLAEFIEERESWLEEINRRQAEMVTARVAAEKLRQRDQLLSTENEALKAENAGQRKRLVELEEQVNKLSGQQNLQQRIHHHAKIKEENNTLRAKNEDLIARLRRTEVLFSRVSDELARYRAADGKTPQIDFEEEQRLKIKLEEVEEERMQVAQKLLTLCTSILKAAGVVRPAREVDPTVAAEALAQLQDRLESTERELSDMKLKNKIEGEKRRLSELRAIHSPMTLTNFAAAQSCASPNSYSASLPIGTCSTSTCTIMR